jgi:hypothetical protein
MQLQDVGLSGQMLNFQGVYPVDFITKGNFFARVAILIQESIEQRL